jgi:hypothetical protein
MNIWSHIISGDGKISGIIECSEEKAAELRKRGWTVIPA